jgi:hypothetical protein
MLENPIAKVISFLMTARGKEESILGFGRLNTVMAKKARQKLACIVVGRTEADYIHPEFLYLYIFFFLAIF